MKNIIRLAIVALLLAITNFITSLPDKVSGKAPVVYGEEVDCTESGV